MAIASDHPITGKFLARHAKILAAVLFQCIKFGERVFIEQQQQTLAGGELALIVLGVDTFLTTTKLSKLASPLKFVGN